MVSSNFDIVNFGMGDRYSPQVKVANVSGSDQVGVLLIATKPAPKNRTATVPFLHMATSGTVLGGVGGRNLGQQNTVFLAKLFKPLAHTSHSPVGETSVRGTAQLAPFPELDSFELFDDENSEGSKVLALRLVATTIAIACFRAWPLYR
jgi:hypothetical protein